MFDILVGKVRVHVATIRAVAGQRRSPELSFANKTKMFFRAKNKRRNIAVFSEKTDVPHLPNQSMVAISVMKL